jgi:hypothetical protein
MLGRGAPFQVRGRRHRSATEASEAAQPRSSEPQQLPFLACPGGQKLPPLFWVWLPWGSTTIAPEGVYTAQPDKAAATRRMANAFKIDSVGWLASGQYVGSRRRVRSPVLSSA